MQHLKHETASLAKKIELLEVSKRLAYHSLAYKFNTVKNNYCHLSVRTFPLDLCRKLLGEGLGSCSISELQQIEQQLEKSVCTVRARKVHVERNKRI